MHIGVFIFATDYAIDISELARALEERGFESLFLPEHTHIPTSRKTPFRGGEPLPKEYLHTYDPFVALSFAAAATTKLRLGTGICLVPQRDPITTAKCVASLDRLSGGRFIFGIGGGWNVDEMENHGARYATRFKLLRERVLAMKALWTEEEAAFHGEMVDFDPVWSYPKPVQKPHPPVIVGGAFPHGARRAIAFGDGWMPHISRQQYGDVTEFLQRFRQMAAEGGRDPETFPVTAWACSEDADRLKRYSNLGIVRACVSLPSEKEDTILPVLDRWAGLIRAVNG